MTTILADSVKCPKCRQPVHYSDFHFDCPAEPRNQIRAERARIVALLDAAMNAPTHDLAYINIVAVLKALRAEGV